MKTGGGGRIKEERKNRSYKFFIWRLFDEKTGFI
ncbi:MAG TPA: hypothetical protein DHV15_03400 [Treponema sp.]|nr:hypothetical protein [Treponema sp.]